MFATFALALQSTLSVDYVRYRASADVGSPGPAARPAE
jgi:hypothetical protein